MNKKVNLLFSSFPDYSGNPKALYEYINKNYSKSFNSFWVFYSKETISIIKSHNLNINYVLFGTDEYYSLMKKINIIFDTNGGILNDKNENQIYINLWHGSSPKKKGYLLNKENFAPQDEDYYKNMHIKTDYVIVPSEFSRLVFSSAFDINIQRVIALGYCRDDYLYTSNGKKLLKKLTNIDIDKFDKILCYLPTFRTGCNRSDSYNFWDNNFLDLINYDENILYEYLEKNNYLLIIKKHPSEEAKINIKSNKNIIILDEETLNDNLISIYEILNSIDLLIADYSSVYVEYMLLNRPVVFLHRNIDEYSYNRGIILNNIDFWSPGPQVETINDLIKEIDSLLSDKSYYFSERNNFTKIMFDNNTKDFCKKTFDFLFDKNLQLKCTPFITEEKVTLTNLKDLSEKNSALQDYNNALLEENEKLKAELDYIHYSRSYKLFSSVQKFKKILKKGK